LYGSGNVHTPVCRLSQPHHNLTPAGRVRDDFGAAPRMVLAVSWPARLRDGLPCP
jgi:hypothetical protein